MSIERFKNHVATSLKNIEHAQQNPISCDIDQVIEDEKNFLAAIYFKQHPEFSQLDQMICESYFRYFLQRILKIEIEG